MVRYAISELNSRLAEPWSKTSVVATAINGMMLTVAVVGVQGLTAVLRYVEYGHDTVDVAVVGVQGLTAVGTIAALA